MDGDQSRGAGALGIEAAQHVPRALGGDHGHINIGGWEDLVIVDVEAVCEHQHIALDQPFFDGAIVYLALQLVGDQHHDNIRGLGHLISGRHLEASLLGIAPRLATLKLTHHDLASAILEVQGVGMTLAAKTDDADGLVLDKIQICVLVIVDFSHSFLLTDLISR